jgi:hypothetical protein
LGGVRSLASGPAGRQEFRAATLRRARGLGAVAPTRRLAAKLLLAGLALGGLVAGHAVAHLAAVLSPATRDTVLADTGRLEWPVAAVLALAACLYAAGQLALRHDRAGPGGRTLGAAELCRWLAPRLAAAQLLLLLAGSALEPVAPGVPLADLLHRGPLLRGLLAQLVVALLATVLLGWLARTAALLGSLLARPPRPPQAVRRLPRPLVDAAVARAMFPGPLTARGPPS